MSDAVYCDTDAECTMATRGRDVASTADCYCALCPSTALNVTSAERFDRSYQRYCSNFRLSCPVARCAAPPPAVCLNHACTAGTR